MFTDETAIQEILNQLELSWNRYDSQAFAASFAEDANFIQIYGGQLDGRPAIEASHRFIFDTVYKGSHVRFQLRGIRSLGPGVALVLTHAHLEFTEADQPRVMETRPTMIVVKESGQWQIVAFQNTRITEMPAAARAAALLAS